MREAVVIVIEQAQKFVAICRAAGVTRAGYWSPPTGRIEPGETQADAVRREAREELGLDVEPLAKVWDARVTTACGGCTGGAPSPRRAR